MITLSCQVFDAKENQKSVCGVWSLTCISIVHKLVDVKVEHLNTVW